MQIQVDLRNVFGELKAYPICRAAMTFAAIAGTKTLTRHTLAGVLALGYEIKVLGVETRTYRAGHAADDMGVTRWDLLAKVR